MIQSNINEKQIETILQIYNESKMQMKL